MSGTAAALNLDVVNYQLISKTQVASSENNGNDEYEYVYRADLSNTGVSVYDARATVSSTKPEINVTQGNLTFDLVLAGKTVTSLDTFTIRAKNSFDNRLAGNGSNPPLLVWNVTAKTDTAAPVIGVLAPKDIFVASATPAISAQYQDAESGVDVKRVRLLLDGADVTGGATITATGISFKPSTILAEGGHTLELSVSDRIGNTARSTWSFSVDTIPPAISLQKPADGSILANGKPAISAQYQDAGGVDVSKVQLTVDGVNVAASAAVSASGISYQPTAALAQGKHAIVLTVLDMAGNTSRATWNLSINTTLSPSLTPASTDAGVAATAVVSVKIAASDIDGSSVKLQRLDAQGRPADIGNLHDDGLESDATANDGVYTLRFTVYEQNPGTLTYRLTAKVAGETAPLNSDPLTFKITGVATAVTLTQPLNFAFVNISPIIVAGTTSDPNATVKVNGIAAPKSGSSFQLTVPLQEGTNTITAVATNSNGTNTTTSLTVTLDTTPPKVTVTSPADGYKTTENSVTVTGIVNDIVVGTVNDQQARVTVNGTNAQVVNRTYTATDIPLQLGVNTLRIVGTDRTGNSATATIRVTREQVSGPTVKLVSGNNQTGTIATQLTNPLAVQVLNGTTPVANVPVIFKIKENDGLLKSDTSQSSIVVVNTDAAGQAQVTYTLGNRAGAGNNVVEAYSTSAKGIVVFTASANPKLAAMVNVDSGNNQFGAVGQALVLPFVAVVTDPGYNRLGGIPVTFTARQGGGTFVGGSVDANGIATLQTVSDSDGRALATLTLGSQPGQDNNVVEVAATDAAGQRLSSLPAVFTATAKVPGDPANTSISGVVLDNSNNPIPGVTMRLYQTYQGNNNNQHLEVVTPVVTDDKGMFIIAPAPVGLFKLMADGVTATNINKLYPTLEFDLVTVAGQDNTVGMPIYLQSLDVLNRVCVTGTTGGTLNLPGSPGFTLTIKPGSATFPGGSKTGCVSATPVNIDKIPMSPGFGQQPRYVVTIQPVGTTFNPPMSMTMPNVDGLAPRAKTEMYSYDHDLAAFVAIGSATVSADGSTISSDPGMGVMKAGWHCGGNPNSTGTAATCPTCQKCQGTCIADAGQDGRVLPDNKCLECRNGGSSPIKLDTIGVEGAYSFGAPPEMVNKVNSYFEKLLISGVIVNTNLLEIGGKITTKDCCEPTLGKGKNASGSITGDFGGFSIKGKAWPPGPIPRVQKTLDVFGLFTLDVDAKFVGGGFLALDGKVLGEVGYRKDDCSKVPEDRAGCTFAKLNITATPSISAEVGGSASLNISCGTCDTQKVALDASMIFGNFSWPINITQAQYNIPNCSSGLSGGDFQPQAGQFDISAQFKGSWSPDGIVTRKIDLAFKFLSCTIDSSGVNC